jgi:hypothetical protein
MLVLSTRRHRVTLKLYGTRLAEASAQQLSLQMMRNKLRSPSHFAVQWAPVSVYLTTFEQGSASVFAWTVSETSL